MGNLLQELKATKITNPAITCVEFMPKENEEETSEGTFREAVGSLMQMANMSTPNTAIAARDRSAFPRV